MGIRGQHTKQTTAKKVDREASDNQNQQARDHRTLQQAFYDKTRPESEPADGDDSAA
ncbi:hypothetical protein ACFV6F_07590 [Kitasatospora phosalacinea]|uniref:hypothetical protein n=1 Tax=Kitasatospora phosalacinea TaxID=2065 RepID=UPI0036694D7D